MRVIDRKVVRKVVESELLIKLSAEEFALITAAFGRSSVSERRESALVSGSHFPDAPVDVDLWHRLSDTYETLVEDGYYTENKTNNYEEGL